MTSPTALAKLGWFLMEARQHQTNRHKDVIMVSPPNQGKLSPPPPLCSLLEEFSNTMTCPHTSVITFRKAEALRGSFCQTMLYRGAVVMQHPNSIVMHCFQILVLGLMVKKKNPTP